jgi:hypothetical protein
MPDTILFGLLSSYLLSKYLKRLKYIKTIILPVVLYGCETLLLENRVLRRIHGPNREEVTGGWRRLHNDKLHNLYTSSNIIRVIKERRIRWTGHVAHMGEMKNVYDIMVGKLNGRYYSEDIDV